MQNAFLFTIVTLEHKYSVWKITLTDGKKASLTLYQPFYFASRKRLHVSRINMRLIHAGIPFILKKLIYGKQRV
jgi:hypothetical protein